MLGYDGHATLTGEASYRKYVATEAHKAYRRHLADLERLGSDIFRPRTLIRNGPASSNYRNWVGGPANEISPGSAFLYAGYLLRASTPRAWRPRSPSAAPSAASPRGTRAPRSRRRSRPAPPRRRSSCRRSAASPS